MTVPWTIATRPEADGCRVVPSGELDLVTAPSLEQALRDADGRGPVVLDLGELSFMDSSGLAVVLRVVKRSQAEGGRLTVRPGDGPVLRLLKLTGALERLPLAAN